LVSARARRAGMGKRRLHSRTPGGFAGRRGGPGPVSEGACDRRRVVVLRRAVIGPDRRLPCRARTPSPGRLTSAMQSRTAGCDQPPGTERTAGYGSGLPAFGPGVRSTGSVAGLGQHPAQVDNCLGVNVLVGGGSKYSVSDPMVTATLPPCCSSAEPTASSSDSTARHSMLWPAGCWKIWRSVLR